MSSAAFHDIQYKASSGQVNLDQAQGIVECFVAGIGNKDSVGDVCATGAFTKSLMRRKPRVVWGHNWNDPIGKVIEIYEVPTSDPRLPAKMKAAGIGGLYAKVQFNLNSEKGREAFANVAFFGEEQEWSIGYKTLRAQFDPGIQANILYEVELYEVSPVLHGANQLTGTISVKSDEKGGMMPMVISPVGGPSDDETEMEDEMQRKLEEELSARLGAPVKVLKTEDGMVYFSRNDSEGEESKYKCRYHRGNDGVFMFGRPERFMMPKPMPVQMPMAIQKPQPGMPSKPMASTPGAPPVVVPSLVPGATPVSPPMVRFNYEGEAPAMSTPGSKPKLVDEERDLAEALIKITKRYGKFNEDSTGVWAGYKPAAENPVAKIGVKCSNCVLYEGNGKCKIVAQSVEPEGKCRFAVIPDGVVTMGPVQKASYDSESNEEEVKWLEEIEQKYPGEFVSGILRGTLKRRRKRRMGSKTVFMLNEYSEKSLEDFADFNMSEAAYVLPVNPERAFEVKQLIDPIIDFHRVDAYVEDGGIIFTNGVTRDFVAAVGAAVNDPFFQSEKALGRNLAGKFQRGRGLAARFDPYAWDGDNDGIVQEGTAFERPAIPGVNDFASRGKINRRAARQIEKQWNSQRSEGREQRVTTQEAKPETPSVEGLQSGRSANPTARKLDEIINSHDDKWDLDKTDQDFSDYLAELDPDETLDALAEIQQQARIDKAQATEAGVLEDDVTGDDFGSIVKRLMADYDMDEFDAEEEGARLLDAWDEYRRRREHYLTASNAVKRRMRGSRDLRTRAAETGLSSGVSPEAAKRAQQASDENIFMRRTGRGDTLEEVAQEFGISRQEVRQAEMRHIKRMRSMTGDELNQAVYDLRQEVYSLDEAAEAFGKTREEIRKAELNHLKRIRSLPQAQRDAEIARDLDGQGSIVGRPLEIDEVAKKYGITEDQVRRSVLRQYRRDRDKDLATRREARRSRVSSGRIAAEGGPVTPPPFSKSVFSKYDEERNGLASGSEIDWKNPSDGLPSNWDDWSDDDWDTYYSREMLQRERRGPRPTGERMPNGFRRDLTAESNPMPDGSPRGKWVAKTDDMGMLSVYQNNDGTFTATRYVFDDYQGYYTDEYDYDTGYDKDGFDTSEEAMDWLLSELAKEKTANGERRASAIGGKDDPWNSVDSDSGNASSISEYIPGDDSARENAWRDYYEKYPDGISTGQGLSSGKGPYTAGERITKQINKKQPPRTKYDYSGDGPYLPTEEQMTVIDAVMTGENVVVPALAGSGKTSTLVSLAKRMSKEQPDKKLLYLAFNRSAANDAERRFRGIPNVQVMTLDSVGRRWISQRASGQRFIDRIDSEDVKSGEPLNSKTLARVFKINTEVVQGKEVSGDQIAAIAIRAVEKYEISGDRELGLKHFVDEKGEQISPDQLPANVLSVANRLWEDKSSEDGEFLVSYNTLTKMWQLSDSDFSSDGSGADSAKDLVLFDESQDLNPVWNAAASNMSVQRVYVGDPNQAIYGFRGAVNELDSISENEPYVLPLTEVFRFGPDIASVGNRVLSMLGIDKNRMVGRGKPGSVVDSGSMQNPDLVIARTNGGVIRSALKMIDAGKTIGTTKRAKTELDQVINSINRLKFNNPSGKDHPDLAEFTTFDELANAVAEKTANRKQMTLFRLMSEISISDLRRVQKGMQVWDPSDDGETAKDADIVSAALNIAKNDPKIGDMIRSIASQYEKKKQLSPKQWAVLERASGMKRAGGEPVAAIDIKVPSNLAPGSSGKLNNAINYEVVNGRLELGGKTYGLGDQLKAAGMRWDPAKKVWHTPADRGLEALEQISSGGGAGAKKAERPEVVILTAHLSKGLEADNVQLANDFWGPETDPETGETIWPDEEHMHAVYVALTRAKKTLDPGGAAWVYDWTDDSDGEPNTDRSFGGLSSGKSAKKKMNRRPWTEEERQAFADGTRLRAQTIQGKRRGSAPDDMREAGRGGNRAARRGLASGRNVAAPDTVEGRRNELMGNEIVQRAISEGSAEGEAPAVGAVRRAAPGGSMAGSTGKTSGFGVIRENDEGKLVFDIYPRVRERIRRGKRSADLEIAPISKNETRKPGDPWLLDAAKLRQIFKDVNGEQLSDSQIADILGIKESEFTEMIDAPGAGIPETLVSDMLDIAGGGSAGSALVDYAFMPDTVIKTWGYDAAPAWIDRRTGEKLSRNEFESLSRRDIGLNKVEPDDERELVTGDEFSDAKSSEKIASETVVREASSRKNYAATPLARKLGVIGDSEVLDTESKKKFAARLRELGIDTAESTILDSWVADERGGIPLNALRQLEKDGHISVQDVYPMTSSTKTMAKINATQAVVEKLEAAGLDDKQIGRILDYWSSGDGKTRNNPGSLDKHRKAMANGGNARSGAKGEIDRATLSAQIDTANKIIKEKGFDVPELSIDDIMGVERLSGEAESRQRDVIEAATGAAKASPPKYTAIPRDARGAYDVRKLSDKEIIDQAEARKYYIRELVKAEGQLSGANLKEARARRGRYEAELRALDVAAQQRLSSRRGQGQTSVTGKSLSFEKISVINNQNTSERTKGARAVASQRLVS